MRDELENARLELAEMKASIRSMSKIQARLNEYSQASGIRSNDTPKRESGSAAHESQKEGTSTTEWPILHRTNLPRQHSLKRLIDRYYEEANIIKKRY